MIHFTKKKVCLVEELKYQSKTLAIRERTLLITQIISAHPLTCGSDSFSWAKHVETLFDNG